MENYVPVLTTNRRPLAACHPSRAKSLVRHGKATFRHRHGIRHIILNKTKVPKVKNARKLQIRIDTGSSTTGMAVTRDDSHGSRAAVMAFHIEHHGKTIKRRMTKRRQLRHSRRCRKTRYRQPRFDNRTRPARWLPPSLLSRLQNILTWVRRLSRLLPITDVHVETTIFDPQLLRNPQIQGKQYQQGPLYRTNLRAAVLQRDHRKRVYCGKSGKRTPLELDHVVPRSRNGQDRYDNLVTACHDCNTKKDNQSIEA